MVQINNAARKFTRLDIINKLSETFPILGERRDQPGGRSPIVHGAECVDCFPTAPFLGTPQTFVQQGETIAVTGSRSPMDRIVSSAG